MVENGREGGGTMINFGWLSSLCNTHERFSEITAFQHADECSRRIFKAVGHILAITDAPIGKPTRNSFQKFGIVFRGEFVINEAAQSQAFGQHCAHRGGKEVVAGSLAAATILGDQAANRNARKGIE